ncbi:MAG: hypothetical protein KGL39_42205 [Patescibacteria group bacterium]|nr:hypothetical protein [Patescibacteria group bacterium]
MNDEKTIAAEIERLEQKRIEAIAAEKTSREAAFLHSEKFPLHENIAGFPALPLCLFHCDLLRMMSSPFMPPFDTPTPGQTADFLWVVSPHFNRDGFGFGRIRKFLHYRKCRQFKSIAPEILSRMPEKAKRMRGFWEKRWGGALARHTIAVMAIREFVAEALNDRPPPNSDNSIEEPDYYSDFAALSAVLMRNYHGLDYDQIMFIPLKIIYQFLKEIHEHAAAQVGQPALLENGSDRWMDEQLAILNRRN